MPIAASRSVRFGNHHILDIPESDIYTPYCVQTAKQLTIVGCKWLAPLEEHNRSFRTRGQLWATMTTTPPAAARSVPKKTINNLHTRPTWICRQAKQATSRKHSEVLAVIWRRDHVGHLYQQVHAATDDPYGIL